MSTPDDSKSSNSIFPDPCYSRLVTIIAQVDHGKTTLADCLIESNGIISERLAGTLRYLDDLEEEQRRGITMRTSAIGLSHIPSHPLPMNRQKNVQSKVSANQGSTSKSNSSSVKDNNTRFVIHLLDSPGHADFSSEVSSALQCCDAALLVVDAVEGLCARTQQVLREAFVHQLVPILIINKVDRLCTELGLDETEAYLRLRTILESINAASAAMLNSSRADATVNEGDTHNRHQNPNNTDPYVDNIEAMWTFNESNVVFGSALYGWGITIPSLARHLYRTKQLDMKPPILRKYLLGDYKFRDGKVLKWKPDHSNEMPMFSQFALQPLWQIYQAVSQASISVGLGSNLFGNTISKCTVNDTTKITFKTPFMDQVNSILSINSLSLADILQQTGSSTEETVLRSVLRRFRPFSEAVLNVICETGPSPSDASQTVRTRALALQPGASSEVCTAVSRCLPNSTIAMAHVCKFWSTSPANIRGGGGDVANTNGDGSMSLLVGVARVLCGTLRTNETYYCMGPKHDRNGPAKQRTIRLFLLMGSSLLPVDSVPAGHLCAIHGLEDLQLKTLTLSSIPPPDATPLLGFDRGIRPLVKVNVEPENPNDAEALEHGLLQLSLADAAVEVTATAKGERILACLGEIHLEQCLLDLQTTYCGKRLTLRKSEPIVEFGETTEWIDTEELESHDTYPWDVSAESLSPPLRHTTVPPYNEEDGISQARRGRMRVLLSGKCAAIGIRVIPLAESIHQALQRKEIISEDCQEDLRTLGKALGWESSTTSEASDEPKNILSALLETLKMVDGNGNALIESKAVSSGLCVKGVVGDEVFSVDCEKAASRDWMGLDSYKDLLSRLRESGGVLSPTNTVGESVLSNPLDQSALEVWKSQMSGSMIAGFQLGIRAGPVCEEPVHRVLVIVESIEVAISSNGEPTKSLSGGMVIGAMKQGIRCALLSRPIRLMERYLKLTLHSSLNGLGSLYAVLSKRRGKVIEDSMVDGTDLLLITASLPQAESHGLTTEVLRKTSGEATIPELTFWKWERLDEDPFWIPTSLEEREDFGEIDEAGDSSTGLDTAALRYIRKVRERKGLLVDSAKTVVAAEKQRTMKR